MTVHIELKNRQKMPHLLEILKSLDFVEHIRVDDQFPHNLTIVTRNTSDFQAVDDLTFVNPF